MVRAHLGDGCEQQAEQLRAGLMMRQRTQAVLGPVSIGHDADDALVAARKPRHGLRSVELRAHSWLRLVRTSAERFPPAAAPAAVQQDVLSTIARPYNRDIACEVVLEGLTMIIEHHRRSPEPARIMEDLVTYVTQVAKQNGMLPSCRKSRERSRTGEAAPSH